MSRTDETLRRQLRAGGQSKAATDAVLRQVRRQRKPGYCGVCEAGLGHVEHECRG